MIGRGVGNINNYNSLWLLVYKRTPYNSIILATLSQSFDKFTQTAELVCSPKSGELHSNSPRLWNLYLALSKGLTAKKIEL